MDGFAVKVEHLNFRYPGQSAYCFHNLNFHVREGERLGLFGPNGAGKTTFMSLMTGLLSYNEGSIQLFGREIIRNKEAVKKLFGFVPQDFSFYQELTPLENLEFFGAWTGLGKKETTRRANELLEVLGLADVADEQVLKFSGGMKRRVNLAIGVIHKPRLLFLDEPTVGVDVQSRHAIINYLKELNANGTTLLYTSHQLKEAEELCESVALIDKGTIVAQDGLDAILKKNNTTDLEDLFLKLTGKDFRDSDV